MSAVPDPGLATSASELAEVLRELKVWADDPSYEKIKSRVNAAWTAAGRPAGALTSRTTVADCFHLGRRRFNTELVLAVVQALHPDEDYVDRWRRALRAVGGLVEAGALVRVQDALPDPLPGFAGRTAELDHLHRAARNGETVVISAIEGMAGVGKTQLALRAAHRMMGDRTFDRVLFVNLRGFHPDPAQPPADPASVLPGFLRLLGVPDGQIPQDLAALTAAYRARVATAPTLIVLDNAATVEQVRPLLPDAAGSLALVTSRRSLAGLPAALRLPVGVFTPAEAVAFLKDTVGSTDEETGGGTDEDAVARIARRCGHLPLALSLIAAHIRNRPGWTLADHADRLDERHRRHRLDTDVELALDLSYQHLDPEDRRLLRLAALHPAEDFDAYAAAALTGTGLEVTRAGLARLHTDHLLHRAGPDRYAFHDLVRAHAVGRAHDEDRPADHRAALTRLFDHYLATAAAAMNELHPTMAHRRPQVAPAETPSPDLRAPGAALAWLDAERSTLITVVVHTAEHGWPRHATRLAVTLSYYIHSSAVESLTVYEHAHQAAVLNGDLDEQARTLGSAGSAQMVLGRLAAADESLRQSLDLYRQTGDRIGQSRSLSNLGMLSYQTGRYQDTIDHLRQALSLAREAGDQFGQSHALSGIGVALGKIHRHEEAVDCCRQALTLAEELGDPVAVAYALTIRAASETWLGRHDEAQELLRKGLALYRQSGFLTGEAGALDILGTLHTKLGQFERAAEHHRQALAIMRERGDRHSECMALNGLGEAVLAAGRPQEALVHHADAARVASESGSRAQQAHAHAGLGHAHRALGDLTRAREHYRRAVTGFTDLGLTEAGEIRAQLTALEPSNHSGAERVRHRM